MSDTRDTVKRRWPSYLIDCLLLLVLCFLFFWRDLTPLARDRRQFIAGDFGNEFYASARYAASRLWAGHLPLWNPYNDAGHPFLADVQVAFFYPPRLANLLLAAGHEFPYRALEIEALLHFPLVALSTYLLARRLTRRRVGGIMAASAFTFSSYLTGYPILQLAILESIAWLPLILVCLDVAAERLLLGQRRSAVRWSLAGSLCLACSWLAGHSQTATLVTYGSLAFALWRLWPRPFSRSPALWRPRLGLLATFGLVALGLIAVQLLPSLEFLGLSNRAALGIDQAGKGFLPYDLLQAILPAVGVPFTALYVGILPLGLAALALAFSWRPERLKSSLPAACSDDFSRSPRQGVAFWAGSGLLALLLSFGNLLPLYRVFYLLVPGWGLFRGQERLVAWVALAVAMLAGYGAAWLAGARPHAPEEPSEESDVAPLARKVVRAYVWAALAGLGLALVFFVGYQAGREALWGFTTASLFLALALALAALAIHSRRPMILLAVLLLDLFTVNPNSHSGPATGAPFAPQPILAAAQGDPGPYRLVNQDILPATHGNIWGVEELGGASPLRLARYRALLDRVPAPRAWRLLNVKYVLTWEESLDMAATRLATGTGPENKPSYLYELAEPAPRAWLAGQVVVAADDEEIWSRLSSNDFDLERQVLLSARPAGYVDVGACQGSVAWQARQPERLALSVETAEPCVLVVSELDYPGWRASVDGVGVSILRADGLLRALVVDAGQHAVTMEFRPLSLLWGAIISAATLVAAALWWLLLRGR